MTFRFDLQDPSFLIFYIGAGEESLSMHHKLHELWSFCMQQDEPFGVITVYEAHDEHDPETEAAINRVMNDFRRDYRDQTTLKTLAFAQVLVPEVMTQFWEDHPGATEELLQKNVDRFAQYNWGIPGKSFTSIDDAKAWILQLKKQQSESHDEPETTNDSPVDKSVGLFYGSSTGATEYAADEIARRWKKLGMPPLDITNIGHVKNPEDLIQYKNLLIGIPTWNIGELQDDWDIFFPQLDTLDFTGIKVAFFGLGDQDGYPDNYLDAVGILGKKLRERGAELVGAWYDEHYEFTESLAFENGKFMGLGLDELNQDELTVGRIEQWVQQVITEMELQPLNA